MSEKKPTIFCGIDGTLFLSRQFEDIKTTPAQIIPGTLDYLLDQKEEGACIVMVTARPEEMREHTIGELQQQNVPFDQLVMGIERGVRILINDMEPTGGYRALAINSFRNVGVTRNMIPNGKTEASSFGKHGCYDVLTGTYLGP